MAKSARPATTFPQLRRANTRLRTHLKHAAASRIAGTCFDFAFAPHNDYHAVTAFPIAERLMQQDLSIAFISFEKVRTNEGAQVTLAALGAENAFDISDFIAAGHGCRNLIVFNDWDLPCTRPMTLDARQAGINTIGIVEGINDFDDIDTGLRRNAYRSVDWILGAGENDRQYFRDKEDRFRVVGFPRIADSLKRAYCPAKQPRAVINVNFSYGVLASERYRWLASAIEGCRLAGLDYLISQHPADRANLSGYPLDSRSFAELMAENAILISRFSSCIIEALAMGRAVVYHNPGVEKVAKFCNPLGAYSASVDAPGLARALQFELERQGSVIQRRGKFLEEHCDFSRNFNPHEKAALALHEIHVEYMNAAKSTQATDAARSPESGVRPGLMARMSRLLALRHSPLAKISRRWLASPTALLLIAGLTLTGAGISNGAIWLAVSGLALVGLMVAREAILWRWRHQQNQQDLAVERRRAEQALSEAIKSERGWVEQALATERSRRSLVLADEPNQHPVTDKK